MNRADRDEALSAALRAAWKPQELDPSRHAEILARALEDPLAPPTEAELADSVRLREALERGLDQPGADLAKALRASWDPSELERGDQLLSSAVASRARGQLVRVAFGGAAALLALAASLALVVGGLSRARRVEGSALITSRTTSSLFASKFMLRETSGRLDAIAQARSRDLRENRFARWGVE
jgi:hypothetical protein